MFIDGFGLSSYRSFGNDLQLIGPLNKINLFVGQNNSGKSNILRFLQFHYQNALMCTRNSSNGFRIGELDLHIGVNSGRIRLAFGQKRDGPQMDEILRKPSILTLEDRRIPILIDYFLQFPEITHGTDNSWIVYEATYGQALTIAGDLVERIAENRIADRQSSTEGLTLRDWGRLLEAVANRQPRAFTPAMVNEAIPFILRELSPTRKDAPHIATIDAVREIRIDTSREDFSYSGLNIIRELEKLERPDISGDYAESKSKFSRINQFVSDVVGKPNVRLEIPASRKTIQVEIDKRTLPLENLGTGIHEVIILGIASTLLEDQIVCIEEPEIHLHPTLQRKLIRYLDEHTTNQYFMATHSASLIDVPGTAIFHIRHDGEQSLVTPVLSPSQRYAISVDLGYRASDILQANCIIWVEGPSDRIYLKYWLKTYAPQIEEGIHYSIMFYGGRLLSHLSADDYEVDEFISLRKINQNLAILIDSDRRRKGQPINSTKRRIRDEFDKGPGFAWVTAGREIENYVPPELMEDAVKHLHAPAKRLFSSDRYEHCYYYIDGKSDEPNKGVDKVKLARRVVSLDPPLDRFDLSEKVGRVVNFIRKCNDLPVK